MTRIDEYVEEEIDRQLTKERTVMPAKNGKREVTGRMEIGGFEAITVMKSGDVNETDVGMNDPEDEKRPKIDEVQVDKAVRKQVVILENGMVLRGPVKS